MSFRSFRSSRSFLVVASQLPPLPISYLLSVSAVLSVCGLTGKVFGGSPVYPSRPMGMEEDQRLWGPLGTSQNSGPRSPSICYIIPKGVERCFFSGGYWVVLRGFVGGYV